MTLEGDFQGKKSELSDAVFKPKCCQNGKTLLFFFHIFLYKSLLGRDKVWSKKGDDCQMGGGELVDFLPDVRAVHPPAKNPDCTVLLLIIIMIIIHHLTS